jgi:hypothetical protein
MFKDWRSNSVQFKMTGEGKPITDSREEDTLDVLANPLGLKLFRLVALNGTSRTVTSDFLQSETNATRKQYYSNMSGLVNKARLISRKLFHGLDLINRGSKCFWGLKALDMDEFSSGIPAEKLMEIGANLIDDRDILRIVFELKTREGKG